MQSIMCLLIVITLKYSEKHALPLKLPLGSFANLSSWCLFFRKAEQGVGIRGYNVQY